MKASAIEFRLRMAINAIIIVLGFWSPWIDFWGIGKRITLLEWLALEISRLGLFRFTVAAPVLTAIAALIAAVGAILRVWGSAWLGPATVVHGKMLAGAVMADGPYRYVRNPLYLGLWCMVAALAFLMPVSGSLFAMVALTVFLLRLTLGEEAFLRAKLGEPYQEYLRAVPRLIPRLRTTLRPTGNEPHWLRALASELTPIGVFVAFSVFSWSYDDRLMARVIVVSFGLSLVTRAFFFGNRQDLGTGRTPKPEN
jgi:protein-S-isoprenylcysteine O-methyltransferase Ste14